MYMKFLKMSLVAAIFTLTAGAVSAQSYKNTFKIGVMGGASVPSENASANVGLDLSYQHLVTPHVGLGIATGYNQFFGKENNGNTNNNFGVVPVAGLVRYYPSDKGFYLGTDLGYGIITGADKVAENSNVDMPSGGLYLKPELGWHNRNWNVFAHYTKVFTGDAGQIGDQKFNAGSVGVGVAYNLPLGR